jgi:hypothetical protein
MNACENKVSVPFCLSGNLLIIGPCVESISLHWIHPIAFLAFFVIGGVFLTASVPRYLSSLLFQHSHSNPNDTPSH